MIKVTVHHIEYTYQYATSFNVQNDRLYIYEDDDAVAAFNYSQWSHVEKVEGLKDPGSLDNTVSDPAPYISNPCACTACDPQLVVRALHRED